MSKIESIKVYDLVEDLKEQAPEAWGALLAYAEIEEGDEAFEEYELDDITGVISLVREMGWGDGEETVDSCYITQSYRVTTDDGKWTFEVTGSSYRKDQSVCEQEMCEELTVIDNTLVKAEKEAKKAEKLSESVKQWNELFEGKTLEELKAELVKMKYPKK